MLKNPLASFPFAGGGKYISNDGNDEDFGDFMFSSPSSTSQHPSLFPYPSPLMHFSPGGDDDWGEFVASGSGSQFLQHQSTSPSLHPFDPFSDASLRGTLLPEPPANGKAVEKPKGPLPLSIFGEEDLEEQELSERVGDFGNGFDAPSFANHTSPSALPKGELKDLISSLYGQAGDVRNGAVVVKEEEDDFGEGCWEFKDGFSADSRTKMDEVNGVIIGLGMGAATEDSRGSQIVVNRLENGWKDTARIEKNGQDRGPSDASTAPEEPANMSPGHSHSVSATYMHDLLSVSENGNRSIVKNDFKTEFRENAIANGFEEMVPDGQAELLLFPVKNVTKKDSNTSSKLIESPSVQHILQSASREHRLLYINAWCKLAQVCAKELQHGSEIWREALDGNFCKHLLSKGNKYFLALGEVYRVSRILKASARFYEPWLVSDEDDASETISCLGKCSDSWVHSGLNEALLQHIYNSHDLGDTDFANALLESIELIDRSVAPTFEDVAFPHSPSVCRFSLLPFGMLPEMKTTVWNGDWYFTKLANLWANLISPYPPELPCLDSFDSL